MGRRFALDIIDFFALVIGGFILFTSISTSLKIMLLVLIALIYGLIKWIQRVL